MKTQDNLKGADWILSLGKFGQKPGLSRIKYMLDKLGNPQETVNFIHVAGTNGKGSTSAYLATILRNSGYNVGLFTSPFMETFRERFKINDEMIPEGVLVDLVEEVKPFVSDGTLLGNYGHPTQFEIVTAVAMLYFSRNNVDIAVIEVGLGGRWDATNVITPEVSVITNIALEHTDVIGDTIEEIAQEKAGIIKNKIPLISGEENNKAASIIEGTAERLSAPVYRLDRDFNFDFKKSDLKGQEFDYNGIKDKQQKGLKISLLGYHQLKNASLAIAVVEMLKEAAYDISEDDVKFGLKETIWPGRMEIFNKDPFVLFDASHNLEGIRCLSNELRKHFAGRRKIILLIGVLADKEVEKMLSEILPLAGEVILTIPDNPRAKKPADLVEYVNKYIREDAIYVQEDVEKAADLAIDRVKNSKKNETATEEKALICCGSFFLVSPVRNYFRNKVL